MSGTLLLRARWITPSAQAWLRRAGPARVTHVFERACNLANPEDEFLSVVSAEAAVGPFSLLVPGPGGRTPDWGDFLAWVEPGAAATIADGRVAIGSLTVDATEAEVWDPHPEWDQLRARGAEAGPRLAQVRSQLRLSAPAGSLADLLDPPALAGEPSFQAQLLQSAAAPAAALCAALAAEDPEACRGAARNLAGLGGGLTPAGDDFLVGAMHAAWGALPSERARELCEAIASAAFPQTSGLSAAWLRAAARGESGLLWHRFFQALLAPDSALLAGGVGDLASVGHTSGADALAGYLLATEAIPS